MSICKVCKKMELAGNEESGQVCYPCESKMTSFAKSVVAKRRRDFVLKEKHAHSDLEVPNKPSSSKSLWEAFRTDPFVKFLFTTVLIFASMLGVGFLFSGSDSTPKSSYKIRVYSDHEVTRMECDSIADNVISDESSFRRKTFSNQCMEVKGY